MQFTTILRNHNPDGCLEPRKNCFYFIAPGKGNRAARRAARLFVSVDNGWRLKHPWVTAATPRRRVEMEPHFHYYAKIWNRMQEGR